ncbi:hypothetical protein ABAC402_14005 [Asticcacaulis sp. AC402]|nr:hypothetical protein ABAC402_14005 [Asticcacaulis sp. AC402]
MKSVRRWFIQTATKLRDGLLRHRQRRGSRIVKIHSQQSASTSLIDINSIQDPTLRHVFIFAITPNWEDFWFLHSVENELERCEMTEENQAILAKWAFETIDRAKTESAVDDLLTIILSICDNGVEREFIAQSTLDRFKRLSEICLPTAVLIIGSSNRPDRIECVEPYLRLDRRDMDKVRAELATVWGTTPI